MKPLWTFDEALPLIRELQPLTREPGYHLTLGGSVLNIGRSLKDLDLFFLPMYGQRQDRSEMQRVLEEFFDAPLSPHVNSDTPGGDGHIQGSFTYQGKRIDVFIH